jgi:hypothetical protein
VDAVSLTLFHALCEAGNAIQAQRDRFDPGTDAWLALTELLAGVDALVDLVVYSEAIEVPDETD